MDPWPIGVFASIDAGLGVQLDVAHGLKVPTIHLHAPAPNTRTAAHADQFLQKLDRLGIRLTAVFGGFDGESYADIPTTQRTVGLVPRESRAERTREMLEIADFARRLGCDVVALHLGFIPHRSTDRKSFEEVVDVTRRVCDHCAANQQRLHLETGQETADELLDFLQRTQRDNLFVNFDPANMILYGTGNPIEALRKVGPHVRSVHCKDGTWAARPGVEWGRETPLGEGDVGFENFLRTLHEIGYQGPLTIEREIAAEPERQKSDIGAAIELLNRLKSRILT